jgi:ABC-type uncharacterized transport system substrate-binding protein
LTNSARSISTSFGGEWPAESDAKEHLTTRRTASFASAISEGISASLSYGVDRVDTFRRAATYVDRILRGAKPAELPVQLPTRFEMAVNLKTAKSLGLTVPQSILLRADEVVE